MTDDRPAQCPPACSEMHTYTGSCVLAPGFVPRTADQVAARIREMRSDIHLAGWALAFPQQAPAPPPRVDLPPSVDALDDDTYDLIRARHAHLETVWQRQADEIGRLIGELDSARTAIARVRELHQPAPDPGLGYIDDVYGEVDPACTTCGTSGEYAVPWPCPTIRALDDDKDQT